MRFLLRRPKAVAGITVVVFVIFVALSAPILAPYDPNHQDLLARLRPPVLAGGSPAHFLGTDALGRDMLSRVIYGSRISLLVGLVAILISGVIGVILGAIAGYLRGTADAVVMRLVDLQMSLPFLVLALAIIGAFGSSLRNLIAVLIVSGWAGYARVSRGQVLTIRERDFVQAARATGASQGRIILTHVLPFLISPTLVVGTIEVGRMILTEASLSFLGLGVPADTPTWGSMAADGRDYLTTAWWVTTMPGTAIFITVLGINLLGDALRDLLDPTLRVG